MAYRKKTLRRMSPTARKVARIAGELNSCTTRLKNLIPLLQDLDLESEALATAKQGIHLDPQQLELLRALLDTLSPDIAGLEELKEAIG